MRIHNIANYQIIYFKSSCHIFYDKQIVFHKQISRYYDFKLLYIFKTFLDS